MPVRRKPEARKLREVSRQAMVAVPAWVRRRLGVGAGDDVYFHRHRGGEVVLSSKPTRSAGTMGRRDLEEELAGVGAERDDWKRQALGKGSAQGRADYNLLASQLFRHGLPLSRQLDELLALVRALSTQLPRRRRVGRLRLPPGVVVVDVPPPDAEESPASTGEPARPPSMESPASAPPPS